MAKEDYSIQELIAVVFARDIQDGELGILGASAAIPMAACQLAQKMHAPNMNWISGGSGCVNPRGSLIASSSSYRASHRADAYLRLEDVSAIENRRIDFFFAGGIQCDPYGNLNLVGVGDWKRPKFRGPGTIGLVFLPRAKRFYIYTTSHSPRLFVETLDFRSGIGFLRGREEWEKANFPGGGPSLVVTDIATLDFDPQTLRMRLKSVHPGKTIEEIQEKTGFNLVVPDHVPETQPPLEEELRTLREIDVNGLLR
ncbi:MAG: CoA-transferase subunit beta [Candidatus Heimdallarchaeota archaeon]